MDELEPCQVASRELVDFADCRGIDLRSLWETWVFTRESRMIYFWHEKGEFHFTLQGEVGQPTGTTAYDSYWGESGVIGGMDDALQLLLAWLQDRKAVAALPARVTTTWGTS